MLVWYSGGLVRRFSDMLLFGLFWGVVFWCRLLVGLGYFGWFGWLGVSAVACVWFWLLSLCFWVAGDFCWWIDLVPTCLGSVVFGEAV